MSHHVLWFEFCWDQYSFSLWGVPRPPSCSVTPSSSLVQLQCKVSSLSPSASGCSQVFCLDTPILCLHNQPLQVRSYSVKFPLSPVRCCQAWYSYSVKFPLSHPLLLGVSLVQLRHRKDIPPKQYSPKTFPQAKICWSKLIPWQAC